MAREINLLSDRKCKTVGDGKHADGLGLFLLVKGDSRAWVLRYTAADGRRRDIGLGALDDVSLKNARELASAPWAQCDAATAA